MKYMYMHNFSELPPYLHPRIQKFLSEWVNIDNGFLVDEGRKDPSTNKSEPPSACQRDAIQNVVLLADV